MKNSAQLQALIDKVLMPGDTILTNNKDSYVAGQIRESTTAEGEKPSLVNHACKYIGYGLIVDIGATVEPDYLNKYFQGQHDVWLVRRTDISYDKRIKIVYYMMKQINRQYDWLQIAGFKIYDWTGWKWTKKVFQIPGLEVCSTAITKADRRAGVKITKEMIKNTQVISPDITYNKYTPDDLHDIATANPDKYLLQKIA
jgi:hypothetical protein